MLDTESAHKMLFKYVPIRKVNMIITGSLRDFLMHKINRVNLNNSSKNARKKVIALPVYCFDGSMFARKSVTFLIKLFHSILRVKKNRNISFSQPPEWFIDHENGRKIQVTTIIHVINNVMQSHIFIRHIQIMNMLYTKPAPDVIRIGCQ